MVKYIGIGLVAFFLGFILNPSPAVTESLDCKYDPRQVEFLISVDEELFQYASDSYKLIGDIEKYSIDEYQKEWDALFAKIDEAQTYRKSILQRMVEVE